MAEEQTPGEQEPPQSTPPDPIPAEPGRDLRRALGCLMAIIGLPVFIFTGCLFVVAGSEDSTFALQTGLGAAFALALLVGGLVLWFRK